MITTVFQITLLFLYFLCHIQTLPDILWDPRNPLFDPKRCSPSSRKFYAKLNDVVPILCGNEDLNFGFEESYKKYKYNYNIFMTESREEFDDRNAERATLLKNCKQIISQQAHEMKCVVVKHKETLREYAPMTGHIYEAGKIYYFFTTSNGTEISLKNKIGDRNSMGFEVSICPPEDSCLERNRLDVCLYPQIHASAQRSSEPFAKNGTIYTICIAGGCFILGIFVALAFIKTKTRLSSGVRAGKNNEKKQSFEKNGMLLSPTKHENNIYPACT